MRAKYRRIYFGILNALWFKAVSSVTETRYKHEEALRLLEEGKNKDSSKQMIDELNKQRLEANLEAYGNLVQSTPSHIKDHDKRHLETTYNKDYYHPYPELLNQKSELTVSVYIFRWLLDFKR